MSLIELICNSYGEETYKITRELQRKKVKAAVSKNQLIFFGKYLTLDVTPKSFRIKPPIKSQKATRITKEYRKNLFGRTMPRTMTSKDYEIATSK